MKIQEFYDQQTGTLSYIINDGENAAIIDPVLNYDQFSGKISHQSTTEIINYLKKHDLKPKYILETHIHADHLTAASYLKEKFPTTTIAISENVEKVIKYWNKTFEINASSQNFDKLLKDGEKIALGAFEIEVISTPGHTPSCLCYKIGDNIFVGDLIFAPDIGTARCDFPGSGADESFSSLQKILAFSDATKLYSGHDYPPQSRSIQHFATIKEQKQQNIMIGNNINRQDFTKKRQERDAKLPPPKLLYPALQVNICAGKLPKFLKIPVND